MTTRADEYFQRARKAERQRNALRQDNARLTEALRRIADAESGVWGQIARETLHPVGATDCAECGQSGEHAPVCPVGRGLERFAVVNALGGVVGHEWLSPQRAAEVRAHIKQSAEDDAVILKELLAAQRKPLGGTD